MRIRDNKIFNDIISDSFGLYRISNLLIFEIRRIFNHNYCDYEIDDMKDEIFADSIYFNMPPNLFNLCMNKKIYISKMAMNIIAYIPPFKKDKKKSIKEISTGI